MPLTFAEPIRVLLVEDSPVDAKVAIGIIGAAGVLAEVRHAPDGVEALSCLRGDDADPFRPDVVLLDLSLPRMRGIDVIHALAQDPALAGIPVVVLTGSGDREDVLLEARHLVRSYLRKPLDAQRLGGALHDIENRVRLNRLRGLGGAAGSGRQDERGDDESPGGSADDGLADVASVLLSRNAGRE